MAQMRCVTQKAAVTPTAVVWAVTKRTEFPGDVTARWQFHEQKPRGKGPGGEK